MKANHPLDCGSSAEEEFFRREDQRLIERLRALNAAQTARAALSKASGIANPAVLDKLLELKTQSETIAALSVVPLVEVAWADRTLDAKERQAVLASARESGFAPGSAQHALLEAWLDRCPSLPAAAAADAEQWVHANWQTSDLETHVRVTLTDVQPQEYDETNNQAEQTLRAGHWTRVR